MKESPRAPVARRSPVSAPGLTLSVAGAFGIGVGAGVPVRSLLFAASRRETAYSDPLLDVGLGSDWIPGWTPGATIASAQDAELTVLLKVVLGLTALLVTVALVNLVTLLLVRGTARRPEIAVRAAVGATRAHLATQLLKEGVAFALVGVAAGGVIAAMVFPALTASWPGHSGLWGRSPSAGAAALVVGVFVLALVSAWLAPVPGTCRKDLRRHLAGGGRATPGRGEVWVRNGLVVFQVAALLVLLTAATLLLLAVVPGHGRPGEPGFDPRTTLAAQVELPGSGPAARSAFYRAAQERIAAVPGVRDVSFATPGAWVGLGPADQVWSLCTSCWEGNMFKPASTARPAIHAITPGAFEALGARMQAGREFTAADTGRVVVLNSSLALALFPRGAPVGQQVRLGGGGELFHPGGTWYTVLGVVDEIRARGIGVGGRPAPALYLPALRHPPARMGLAVRTAGDPMRYLPQVVEAVGGAGSGARLRAPVPMERSLARFGAPRRWFATVFIGLAGGAVLLAVGGLYGVMSYNVARRTREIGIRMAIGAGTRQIRRAVRRQSVRIVAAGVVAGLFAAVPLARALQLVVHGVRPFDPWLFALISATLAAVALAASHHPARLASRLEPYAALREE